MTFGDYPQITNPEEPQGRAISDRMAATCPGTFLREWHDY